ncbi:outer membrane protein transport protein [Myxococcota bacterium]|nr:outer membrane protein transport protein [Myxococcota bacterium]
MNSVRVISMVLAVSSILSHGTGLAAGLATTDRSVAAMGSGGAGSVRFDDPASSAYNPATGVMSTGLTGSVGLVLAAAALEARGDGFDVASDGAPALPPMLHLRWGDGDLAFGASLTVPFGSRVVWPSDWPGRFELTAARLTVLRASAFGALRFGPVAIAAGPFVDRGTLALERRIDLVETEGTTSIDTRATGVGASVAVLVHAHDGLDVGLAWQSRSTLSFSGWADFDVPPELRGRAYDQELSTRLRLPDRLTLGARWVATPELELVADLELVLWSTVDRLVLDFSGATTPDVDQPRAWETTIVPRLGATLRPSALAWLAVRAGVFVDPSPVPSATASPSSPDSTRIGVSAGASFALMPRLSIDVAYQLALMTGVRSELETASLAAGVEYGGHVHLAGAALTLRSE